MTAQNYIIRKGISILLIIALFITGFYFSPINSFAATKTVTETKTVNDLAYYDIWKHADGTWQKGIKQGSFVSATFTIGVSGVIPSNAIVTNCTGEFDSEFNNNSYNAFIVTSGFLSANPAYSNGEVTYTVNTTLISRSGDNGRNIKNDEQAEVVEGYRYYIPVTFDITYQYEVEIGDFEPGLSLPSSAKQGESYTASDSSTVDNSITIDHAVLEKHYGDGNWETVTTWNGTGKSGENTGGSVNESCNEVCTIIYRLTVYDTYDQKKSITKTISITDGREVNGTAILELPKYTYEGHPALAEDVSEFEVNGTDYSARRAYEEGVATNQFLPLPSGSGTAKKDTKTTANVVFPHRGKYNVKLAVETVDGKELSDTKPIEVRKTPYIIDNLGGFQKQNRKQILDIAVATYPGKPITDYSVVLKDLKTGQSITLTQSQPQQNNATMKTRTITTNGDTYWTNFQLLFLTKNTTSQAYQYTIYMKDSKGDTDTVQKTFTVAPDLPPNAQISIPESFIRNKGTNIAEIQAEDSSTTDGDQLQRTWTVQGINIQSLPGFKDSSFGSRQIIQYNKTGVGEETISLFVRDIWNEPTLEEYITADDYKSASVSAATEVINIAPTVRLESIQTEEADIVLLSTKASQAGIEAGINSLKAALIEAGIDANLQVLPVAEANSNGYRNVANFSWPVSINCGTCQSTGLLYDSDYVYRVESVGRTVSGYQEVCTNPHTIYAMKPGDPLTGEASGTAWSYTVNESTSFKLLLDADEKYIYILCSDTGKTVILNQNNGAYVTTLNLLLPSGYMILRNDSIYILTASNIQKYDTNTGNLSTVANVGGSLGRMQGGKLVFVMPDGGYKFNYVEFDLNTETFSYTSIPELGEVAYPTGSKSGVYPSDMDNTGKICFYQNLIYDNDISGICLWLADIKSQRVYNLGQVTSLGDGRGTSLGFVKDETGKAMYMYHSINNDDSTTATTRRYFYLNLYTLGDGDTPPTVRGIYGKKDNRLNYNGISYAKYHSQENAIYLMQGSDFGWNGLIQGIQCRIQLPSWSVDFYKSNWGWDDAEEYGTSTDYNMYTYMSHDAWTGMSNRVKIFKNSITAEQAKESVMTRLASFRDGVVHVIEENYTGDMEAFVARIKEMLKQSETLKVTATNTGEPAALQRNFNLKPGQTYYYEYEIKDRSGTETKAIAPDISMNKQDVYTGTEDLGSYVISKAYVEDFNDSQLDPFFTSVDVGLNGSLTTPAQPKGSRNRNIASAANIKFTVPAGKKAIAVMDVYVSNYDLATHGCKSGAYINGQRYDRPRDSNYNITNYTHPYLLKEGENKISAYCCWYGRGTAGYYTSIDNLKIYIVEDSTGSAANSFAATKEEDGWVKASGKFIVPLGGYKAQAMVHYADWPPELKAYSSTTSNYTTNYDFTIPEGKVGRVFAAFSGYSSRSDDSVGPITTVYSSYTHIGTEHDYYYYFVSNGECYMIGDYQGLNQFTARGDYRSSCGFSKLETYVYPDNLLGRTDFFFDGNRVYSMAEKYDGKASISLNFQVGSLGSTSEYLLKNLKIYYIKDGKKIYVQNDNIDRVKDLEDWTESTGLSIAMSTEPVPEKEEDAPLVYKKGQLVSYNIFYDDYENDPSKKQYWRYTHTPMNDGPNPQAAVILDEDGNVVSSTGAILTASIPRFYIDGKYTVEHWQEDNTNRTGGTSGVTDHAKYDKLSNVESITFYIEGGGLAPWITSIKTIPSVVKEGDQYRLQIGVDDAEKDILRLTTEVYQDKKLIYTHKQANIIADANGTYPYITTGFPPIAEAGKFDVVCTVRDWAGAGIGSYKFTVVSEGKITGFVNHTDQWDDNRKKYNLKRFSEEVNRPMQLDDYLAMSTPRKRGTNVFWSGEKYMLRSETEGKPSSVQVQIFSLDENGIRKSTGYSTELFKTGKKNASGAELWEGSLWDSGMINKWGRKAPEPLIFSFTACYSGGTTKNNEVGIIVDSRQDYWQLHRLW